MRPYYTDIEQVEAVDPSTLRVRLHHPSGGLPAALAGYFQGIPMASPTSYATYGKDWVRHPTGTGPYMLQTPPTHPCRQWSLKPTGFFWVKLPLGRPHFSIYDVTRDDIV